MIPNNEPLSSGALEHRVLQLQQKLAESGHRVTPQRLHILRALLDNSGHPVATEIWDRVRQVSPSTSLGTIYKTLDTLQDMGEVLELEMRDGSRHYDAVRPVPHPHVLCTSCAQIADVDIPGLDRLQIQAEDVTGYQIDDRELTFYGLCRLCRPQTTNDDNQS